MKACFLETQRIARLEASVRAAERASEEQAKQVTALLKKQEHLVAEKREQDILLWVIFASTIWQLIRVIRVVLSISYFPLFSNLLRCSPSLADRIDVENRRLLKELEQARKRERLHSLAASAPTSVSSLPTQVLQSRYVDQFDNMPRLFAPRLVAEPFGTRLSIAIVDRYQSWPDAMYHIPFHVKRTRLSCCSV